MRIEQCKCNHMINPVGYTFSHTVFSWSVKEAKGTEAEASRIVVKEGENVICDTGWSQLDDLACDLPLTLKARTRYIWTVAVRSNAGEEAVSDENYFETSKMEEPWAASWIGCEASEGRHPIFSKKIACKGDVASARLYISGLGLYEARIDGVKVGEEYLTPFYNDYRNWVQYVTYDVTEMVNNDAELAVELGNGWCKGRLGFSQDPRPAFDGTWRLIAELRLTYADGSEDVIGTDESWDVCLGTTTFSNIYDGEHRDDTLGVTPAGKAILIDAPQGELMARKSVRLLAQKTFAVKEVIQTPAGETVLNIGQNISGIFRLHVNEEAGTVIHLQFGEILQGGNFYNDNLRSAKAEYYYTSDGTEKVIEPKFTFFGYQFVKIEGAKNFKPEDFTAVAIYSEIPDVGFVTTGHELVNKVIENTRWGMRDNFVDTPTDCPQRDERLGWTGDAQVFSGTALYLADTYAFYNKFLYDMHTEQKVNDGMVPDFVPYPGESVSCATAWGDAATIIPWNMYLYTGDDTILKDRYEDMKAWVDYITKLDGNDHAWRRHFHYGDWLALDSLYETVDAVYGATDEGFIADVFYRKSALIVAKAARHLGKEEEAKKYEALAEKILSGIVEEYYSPTGRCCLPTMTASLLTITEDLNDKERAAKKLAELLEYSNGKLKTGFIGTPLLCKTLSDIGMRDRAFGLLLNEEYPGWLYEVKMGATTIWERWNSVNPDGSISSTGMNSLNHYSYGAVVEWIFSHVAGIRRFEEVPGFKHVVIAPELNRKLGKVSCDYRGYHVAWEILDVNHVKVNVTVPFGRLANVILPASDGAEKALAAGSYEFTYETAAPLWGGYSTNSTIKELMADPDVKAFLLSEYPQITQVPPSMGQMSLRALASLGGEVPEEQMKQLDAALAAL
ncbi:MAG: family 78 glycoside hydrolase catalytic domain [Lachnospiraceae bacterium]|nr:family 78 glycoside hydrolase catalytic domain [Lachnospiraceae bacterium]